MCAHTCFFSFWKGGGGRGWQVPPIIVICPGKVYRGETVIVKENKTWICALL